MIWTDIPFRPANKVLRQFAAGWLVCFLALGAYQCAVRHHIRIGLALMGMAIVIGAVGLVKPSLVRWIFVGWMVLAFPIGWLMSQAMLGVMFYGIITPVAVLFRLRGRDLLRRERERGVTTFWLPKEMPKDVHSYFRQY